MFTIVAIVIAVYGELSNTTLHRRLSTSKADVLAVISNPEESRASRCWAARSLSGTDRSSTTTQMAPLPPIEVVYGANIISFARQKSVSIIEARLESLEMVGLFQPSRTPTTRCKTVGKHVVRHRFLSKSLHTFTGHVTHSSFLRRGISASPPSPRTSRRRDRRASARHARPPHG